jgi:hypothetical protein
MSSCARTRRVGGRTAARSCGVAPGWRDGMVGSRQVCRKECWERGRIVAQQGADEGQGVVRAWVLRGWSRSSAAEFWKCQGGRGRGGVTAMA